jgi:hypothetical protein
MSEISRSPMTEPGYARLGHRAAASSRGGGGGGDDDDYTGDGDDDTTTNGCGDDGDGDGDNICGGDDGGGRKRASRSDSCPTSGEPRRQRLRLQPAKARRRLEWDQAIRQMTAQAEAPSRSAAPWWLERYSATLVRK